MRHVALNPNSLLSLRRAFFSLMLPARRPVSRPPALHCTPAAAAAVSSTSPTAALLAFSSATESLRISWFTCQRAVPRGSNNIYTLLKSLLVSAELTSFGLFAGMRSVLWSEEGRSAMADAPQRQVDVKEKAISAAGAAIISAVIVNPLDVAKTRLQAQGAGVSYQQACEMEGSKSFKVAVDGRCPPDCPRTSAAGASLDCPPRQQYKNTLDVMRRVAHEEGFFRLWRGLNASLAIAIPTVGIYLPCYDILREALCRHSDENSLDLKPYAPLLAGSLARSLAVIVCSPLELAKTRMQAQIDPRTGKLPGIVAVLRSVNNTHGVNGGRLQGIRVMWTGVGAQLARDVPFSAICWSVLEPTRVALLGATDSEPHIGRVLGANFAGGMLAGGFAAAATCPLDVVKTWRQIERDPAKAMSMSLRQTLTEIWRKGGMRGLFTGAGARIGRAAPSTGIVVSFYEVVKYVLHRT